MKKFVLICVVLLLVACNGGTDPLLNEDEAVVSAATLLPEPTDTSEPTSSPKPTDTPMPEPTDTPQPTNIPEPTATAIPAPLSPEELDVLLIESARAGDLENVKLALAEGANIEAEEKLQKYSSLSIAALVGHREVVVYLLEQGADVNTMGRRDVTPLILAAKDGNAEIISILIAAGADINHQDDSQYKQRPLHWAAQYGHTEAMVILLDAGVNIDILEDTHSTALMYAAYYNSNTDITELLIERGADLNLLDNINKTALYWANVQNHPDIAALIEAAGGE